VFGEREAAVLLERLDEVLAYTGPCSNS